MTILTKPNIETVVIQLTTKCPYHCIQCYMECGDNEMTFALAKNVVDDAVALGAKVIQLTGGEPLTHEGIFDVINYVSKKGIHSVLATSGFNCSDEVYSKLKVSGLTALCVSLNGISEEINSQSREPYAEAIHAIHTARRMGLPCFVNVVVTDHNIKELALLSEYVKSKDVIGVNVLRPIASHNGKYIPLVSIETLEMLEKIVKNDPDYFLVERCYKEYWDHVERKNFVCQEIGMTTYFVNVNGLVAPCSNLMRCQYPTVSDMLAHACDWRCGCL